MPQRLVYFNGSYVSERDARISIFDSALMFGDMVFEMTRSFKQKPYRLRNHMDRLYASMKYTRIDCGLNIEEMESATEETIERNLPAFDFQPVGTGRPGPIYRQLIDAWSEEVGVDIPAQVREYAKRAKSWVP